MNQDRSKGNSITATLPIDNSQMSLRVGEIGRRRADGGTPPIAYRVPTGTDSVIVSTASGAVLALAPGSATVTATDRKGDTGQYPVSVEQRAAATEAYTGLNSPLPEGTPVSTTLTTFSFTGVGVSNNVTVEPGGELGTMKLVMKKSGGGSATMTLTILPKDRYGSISGSFLQQMQSSDSYHFAASDPGGTDLPVTVENGRFAASAPSGNTIGKLTVTVRSNHGSGWVSDSTLALGPLLYEP